MTDLHQDFYQQLTHELEIAQTLHRLLTQERELLDPPQLHGLKDIQALKKQSLNELQQHSAQRCAWLKAQDISLDKHCIYHPKLQSEDSEQNIAMEQLWQRLADQFVENRKLTDMLSNIVLQARQRTQNLLKILRGQKNAPNLYNKSGQAFNTANTNGYAKA